MKILGIETSCDETAASIVEINEEPNKKLEIKTLSNIVASQIDIHKKYGGVVPEIASRHHLEDITWVTKKALGDANICKSEIDAVAVTHSPGLIGALLVGVNFAKSLAYGLGVPIIPVNHIAGHIASNYLSNSELEPPFIALVVSGGHTHIFEVKSHTEFNLIGRTRDDAAGECFDKSARVLGFPYPGGIHIDKMSKLGDKEAYKLPTPKVTGSEFDFSFSGLKTAVINLVHNAEQRGETINKENLSASLQNRIAEITVGTTIKAMEKYGYDKVALAGGVSANSGVRNLFTEICEKKNYKLYMPELKYCGDNGAMIACQGYFNFKCGLVGDLSLNAYASSVGLV
ncbi:MAG: tRNA (adenosine(37)-N6)-threonylcarbamoyltransferase complex transferase subunit TsaD [Ruminococcus sp.]|jgi:N6-L-threonylcarbamoyladenine synthase|nr:tRNA (adenosine(37)-N6)-threonylcarbamoyltransferase complex transferase subunit TsaD [Ruminococcus sp.]